PLDEALSLPPHCYSDLLRDWAEYCTTDESYDESNRVLKRILGISLSKQALETAVDEDAADVEAFYEQKATPPPEVEGSILVVQADGKGVPMVRTEAMEPTARLGKGQKRTKKKESVVTAIYTIEPYLRTPQQVADALLPETEQTATQPSRPAPIGKEVRATLQGKDFALERLARRVTAREGEHIQQRAALTDGAEALQNRILALFPGFTLVLDIMHALGYLWDAANALLGETHPGRMAWVKEHLLSILSGDTEHVILALESQAQDPSLTDAQRKTLDTTIGYYRRNQPYMHYDGYLEQGWPISSGVVEGACGHLVKGRMEQSGMRWTPAGAQSILEIRAVRINEDWD
ncbi:MAG: ISKra4 family transposase, partial [Anaerolineaceae bacterium]|nr:ISKra4 family transposase [Anaerolineaceae bacterium]